MQPKQFKILPSRFREIRKKTLLITIPVFILVFGVGVFIAHSNSSQDSGTEPLLITIPVAIGFGFFGLNKGMNRQKELLESFTLTIDANSIWRDQKNTPSIHIYTSEVQEILKQPSGCILIKTNEPQNLIMIPAQIERPGELEMVLNTIKPIVSKSGKTFSQKYGIPLGIGCLGLMVLFYTSTHKLITLCSGMILTGALVWAFIEGQKSKNIDNRTKKGLLWVVVVLLSILVKMVSALIN